MRILHTSDWHVGKLLGSPHALDGFQILTIPGGFSYGDDLGAGRIFATRLGSVLDEALRRFEQSEPRAAEVVKLRFFAGLTVEEASEVTGLSVRTVNREWKFARAWLFKALE